MMRLAATGLTLVVLVGCSQKEPPPRPPQNAGTLIVHALWTAGPILPNGHAAAESPMGNTRIQLRATDGTTVLVTTDEHGNARVLLAPGRYRARLADLMGFDGRGGNISCGVGPKNAIVRIRPQQIARAEVGCVNP